MINIISNIIKKYGQFIKFVIVGTVATAIHYSIYYILEHLGISYNLSYATGYLLSFFFNFFASNYFTFNTKPDTAKGVKFLMAHLFNFILQMCLLNIYIYIGVPKWIAPLFVYVIAIPTNYFLVKKALKKV